MARIKQLLICFLGQDDGQDLIEYTLLLAFVALGIAGLMMGVGKSASGIADEGSEALSSASQMLSGS